MEERIKIKVDEVIAELVKKETAFAEEYESFMKSFFTKEINDMIHVITDFLKGTACEDYCGLLEDGHVIVIKDFCRDVSIDGDWMRFNLHRVITKEDHIIRGFHDDETIGLIRKHADTLLSQKRLLKIFQDNVAEIAADIAKRYDEITGRQIDSLNTVMKMLDFEEKPIRRIKVTVEYI